VRTRVTLTKIIRRSLSKLASYKFAITKVWFFSESYVEAASIPKGGYFGVFRSLDCTDREPRSFTDLLGEQRFSDHGLMIACTQTIAFRES
jgi:hypothetical protein